MKSLPLKLAIVGLMVLAAASVYVFRDAWLGYLTRVTAVDVQPDTVPLPAPAGTREDPFVGQGVIEDVRTDERQLVLRHGEIPGLMGAMTMGFPVSVDIPMDALTVGDAVEFRIETRDTGQAVPVYEIFSVRPDAPASGDMEPDTSQAMFTVDAGRQQLIGVRTALVTYESFDRTLRTIGTVALDETRVSEVHSRIDGWIEETFVDFQFQHVEQGDPLFTIYSPELVATQEEYLLALRGLDTMGTSTFPSVAFGAEDLVRAARRRLELWDISPEQIAALEEAREPFRVMTIHSPVTGHVMVRNAFTGQHVDPETMLYQIADHSVVWVKGDIYENDIASVATGQGAVMRVQALPGREYSGVVTFIDPHLDAQTRTLTVRVEFSNPDLTLKPGMYADIELSRSMGRRLVVPESAVLPTGLRNVVFVDHGDGQMEIRNVRLGTRIDDYYEVLGGLDEGERIVTSGNFLIDAESRLRAAEPVWQGEAVP